MNSSQTGKFTIIVAAAIIFRSSFVIAQEQKENGTPALINRYEEALTLNPADSHTKGQLSVLYHNRAIELANDGGWEEAIRFEEKALRLMPDDPGIRRTLAYLYNNWGLARKDGGKFNAAIDALKTALSYAPEEPQLKKNIAVIYLELADALFRKGEYSNSERMVYDAATYDPDNPYVYVLRGEIAYVQDNYYRAQEQWTKALQISPQLYEIRLKLERLKSEKEREGNFNIREIENFRLKFEGLENQQVTDAAGEILRQAYREVGQDYGLYPQAVVPVIIYPSSTLKELDYFPDWAAGTYDGKIRFGEDLGKTPLRMKAVLYHEYTHAVVHILGGMNVPLWLNEGVAEYEARKFKKATERTQRRKMLLQAVRNNTLFTIEQLGGLDLTKLAYLSPNRIELVYAQSESFVTYIIGRMSLYEVKNLLVRLGAGNGIHKAVKDVLFVDLEVLERDWIDSLQQEREQH